MSISGRYLLIAKSGRVIRESPVPTNLMFDFGQELAFVSGDIFTDKPMPVPVVHLHHNNFDVKFFCEDVSTGDVKKYRHNFVAVSVPEATPELVESIEHFFFGAADFVNEKVAVRNQYYKLFLPLIRAREEMKEEEAKAKASKSACSFLDFLFDLLDDEPEDRMESMLFGLGGRNPMRNPFSHRYDRCFSPMRDSIYGLGERHESTGDSFLDTILGLGGRNPMRNPFFDMILHLPNLHRDSTEKKSSHMEEASPDHVDGTVPATDGGDCPEDSATNHPEETATEDGATDHSEDTAPDGDAGEPSGLSSSEQGTH